MYKSNVYTFFTFIFIFAFIFIGPSCFLDRSGSGSPRPATSWEAQTIPGFACPQDDVTVTWDVGTVTCAERTGPDCVTFTTNDSAGLLIPPFSRMALTGSEVIGQFTADTIFSMDVTRIPTPDVGWVGRRSDLKVATPTSALRQQFGFAADCNPRTNRYDESRFTLNMRNADFVASTRGFGNCVRIVDICNIPDSASRNPGTAITISTVGDSSLPPTRINLGECVSSYIGGLNLTTDKFYQASPESVGLNPDIMGGVCRSEENTNPADPQPIIDVLFILSCDTRAEGCSG
jgi:hypothetical protein